MRRLIIVLLIFGLLAVPMHGTVKAAPGDLFNTGDGSIGSPYLISSQAHLADLATSVNGGNNQAGKYFVLTNDITLTGTWTPIGSGIIVHATLGASYPYLLSDSSNKPFSGTLDGFYNGANHTISGLTTATTTGDFRGLFGHLRNATIKNLAVETAGTGVYGRHHVGGLAGYAFGSRIENCRAYGKAKQTYYPYWHTNGVGGLVGGAINTTITGCYVDVAVEGAWNAGALLGLALAGTSVDNCRARGTVTGINDPSASATYIGGLIGHIYHSATLYNTHMTLYPASNFVSVTNSHADVTVISDYCETGGLIGKIFIEAGSATNAHRFQINVENCSSSGSVTGTKSGSAYFGGLIGFAYAYTKDSRITFRNCNSTGAVSAPFYLLGGLIGYAQGNITVENCHATGNVTGSGTSAYRVGGFIGLSDGVDKDWEGIIIKNSSATGNVRGGSYQVGGFIGEAYLKTQIENCYASGSVHSELTSYGTYYGVGGFIGDVSFGGSSAKNCYSTGRVSAKGAHQAGGFIGTVYYTKNPTAGYTSTTGTFVMENCYASGTVTRTSPSGTIYEGGFIGRIQGSTIVSINNAYFDMTTTGKSAAIGSTSSSATVTGSPVGLTTEEMIAGSAANVASGKYIAFNYQDTKTKAGSESLPWYIDERVTYPYLYYQYNGRTAEETNYDVSIITWNDDIFITDRTDFSNLSGSVRFFVETFGAAGMYFPFFEGANRFAADTMVFPASAFAAGAYPRYSLGSVSASGIVAFAGLPGSIKESDRADTNSDSVTDTKPGDTVTYTITACNSIPAVVADAGYTALNTWKDVKVSDPLANGVTFLGGSVRISYDGGTTFFNAGSGTGVNCYTYNPAAGSNGTLYVYLNDMTPEEKVIVTFQVYVENEAIGRSIRNRGTVEGKLMHYVSESNQVESFTHQTRFDDRNDDLIIDAYMYTVTYFGNEGATSGGSARKSFAYQPSEPLPVHTVLGNGHSELGFTRAGYFFVGWNTRSDGSGTAYTGDGSETLTMDNNHVLYAQWVDRTLNVSIPVKLLWAAFNGDDGAVGSPDYCIINRSQYPIQVTGTLVRPEDYNDAGIALVSGAPGLGELRLDIIGGNSFSGLGAADNPFPDSLMDLQMYEPRDFGLLGGTVVNKVSGVPYGSTGWFRIGGKYGGPEPASNLKLVFGMEFHFELPDELASVGGANVKRPITEVPNGENGRILTPEQSGDGFWIEIARNGDYSLIVRKNYINVYYSNMHYGEYDFQYTPYGSTNVYKNSTVRTLINNWFNGDATFLADNLPADARLREYTVENNVMTRVGSGSVEAGLTDGFSKPSDIKSGSGLDIAFALSYGEAVKFISKTYDVRGRIPEVQTSGSIAKANYGKISIPNVYSYGMWLRSPGDIVGDASILSYTGRVFQYVLTPGTSAEHGMVYPALWVESAIFTDPVTE